MIIVLQQGEQVMIWPWLGKILQSSTIRVTIQKSDIHIPDSSEKQTF